MLFSPMKSKAALLFYSGLFLLMFLPGCSHKEQFRYEKKQSVLIRSLREQMFFEYSTPLKETMKIYMELELANHPNLQLPLEKIYQTEQKLKIEKPQLGCYYQTFQGFDGDKKLYIIMDWNNKDGVIIRFFTNSNQIIDILPDYTF